MSKHAALQVPWLGGSVAGGDVLAGGDGGIGGLIGGDLGGGGLGTGVRVPPVIRQWRLLHQVSCCLGERDRAGKVLVRDSVLQGRAALGHFSS